MIKVFKENKDGKIELTEEELNYLLQEAYNEGYSNASKYTFDSDKYEKIPYWCRPDFVPPPITSWCTSTIPWTCLDFSKTVC